MKHNKKLMRFLSVICVIVLLSSLCNLTAFSSGTNVITASTSSVVNRGSTAYCYVYITADEPIAALDVAVYYDNSCVEILETYNNISCELYDNAITDDCVQYSYILNSSDALSNVSMFYFAYKVLETADFGQSTFIISVGEAYNSALENVSISGSTCIFNVSESVTKKCNIYAKNSVVVSSQEEFTIDYDISTSSIASGAISIAYDPEVLQVTKIKKNAFLDNKIVDINSTPGTIYLSFVGTRYASSCDLMSVTFKAVGNSDSVSPISLKVTELFDSDLVSLQCSGYTTTVTTLYSAGYPVDIPQMSVSAVYDEDNSKVYATITLDEYSRLGAGDFVITFDPNVLTLSNYSQGFSPTYFYVNPKDAASGILKFSIISLTDIISEETVMTLQFDAKAVSNDLSTYIAISGNNVSDSLTESIILNYQGASVVILETVVLGDLNKDGSVDKNDAIYLLYASLFGFSDYPVNQSCDYNHDGSIDKNDAIYLLYHSLFGDERYPLY